MTASVEERRRCPSCGGRLGLKLRWGLETDVLHGCPRVCASLQGLYRIIPSFSLQEMLYPSTILHISSCCRFCSRKGAFIGCSGYPDCSYSRPLDAELGADGQGAASELFAAGATFDVSLTRDPGHAVHLCEQRVKREGL